MLENLEVGDIIHFKNGKTTVQKVEFAGENEIKVTAHFPNEINNSKCDLDFWNYEKNGKLVGGVLSFLNIIKVEKPPKQKEEGFDVIRPGFYKTKGGNIVKYLGKVYNENQDNFYFILIKDNGLWDLLTYKANGKCIENQDDDMDLVEYLGTELPKTKAEPRKFEFESEVTFQDGKDSYGHWVEYKPIIQLHPKMLGLRYDKKFEKPIKFKITMEEILE